MTSQIIGQGLRIKPKPVVECQMLRIKSMNKLHYQSTPSLQVVYIGRTKSKSRFMTSHVFCLFLSYQSPLFYSIRSNFGGYFGPFYLPKYRTSLMEVPKVSSPNKQQANFFIFCFSLGNLRCNAKLRKQIRQAKKSCDKSRVILQMLLDFPFYKKLKPP